MPVSDLERVVLKRFGGAVTSPPVDIMRVPPGMALAAQNCEFTVDGVKKRFGFGSAFNPNEAAFNLFNWVGPNGNLLLWKRESDGFLRYIDVSVGTPATLFGGNIGGDALVCQDNGTRIFFTTFGSNYRSSVSGWVVSKATSGLNIDSLFQPPMTYVPGAPTEPAGGVITAGAHRIAYQIEFRSGQFSMPCPNSASGSTIPDITTFAPLTFTAAGLKNLSWVLNPTAWPTPAVAVWILMTTVANPQRWFRIPGSRTAVPGGSASSKTIAWSISDDDLVSRGEEMTDSMFLWSQAQSGASPFQAFMIRLYSARMVYLTQVPDSSGNASQVTAYASEIEKFQDLSQDWSRIPLPQLEFRSMATIGQALYFFGPNWTYEVQDNLDKPNTWSAAKLVDANRGTLAPLGVLPSTSAAYAWVADRAGLFYFNGAYSRLPISYYQQADWNRINWNAAYRIEILESVDDLVVAVKVPLDGATTPTHLLVWDYTEGVGPTMNYSIWSLASFSLGGACVVQNDLTGAPTGSAKRQEIWLSPSVAGAFLRKMSSGDANPYGDNGQAIDWIYEFTPETGKDGGKRHHRGAQMRARGAGTLATTFYSIDRVLNFALPNITLAAAPDRIDTIMASLLSERAIVRLRNNTLNEWAEVSYYEHMFRDWLVRR